ncbi:hypothetical protein K505DRAFT_363261 [Melanomma pulvis-pyrius CBS 109.77]|uniref:DUF7580 domain-containing protein n=1 Tax=Melanomma pulvis-pyrius CBS 109.77 TaxID=1314802 RepID=A0A6A6X6S0_9PLEO|nr:hypothetical protein K505DRAFT_363261 [Melanomma pulvis-pyrius CBS 109.77]
MSGLEAAGLVVGIIPILLKVVTCYQTTREVFHSLASSSTGVKRLETRFKTQESIFRNECRHILLMVTDDKQLSEMLQDTSCGLWHDARIDDQLKLRVGDNYDALKGTLAEIREMLVEVQKVLTKCAGKLLPQSSASNELFSQFHHKLKFSLVEEKRCKTSLDELHTWNADLSLLRSQICGLQLSRPSVSLASLIRTKIPESMLSLNEASGYLHSALNDVWTCSNTAHTDHYAKLCADGYTTSGTRLDLALSCHRKHVPGSHPGLISEPPLWLYVQTNTSTIPNAAKHPILVPPSPKVDALPLQSSREFNSLPRIMTSLPTSLQNLKSKKRVHFLVDVDDHGENVASQALRRKNDQSLDNTDVCHSTLDLRHSEGCLCGHFMGTGGGPADISAEMCLGYLETRPLNKLVFYNAGDRPYNLKHPMPTEVVHLQKVLGGFNIVQQLGLALKVSRVVLSFHDTPWLPPAWRLQDLAFFGRIHPTPSNFTVEDLKTLHLTAQIPNRSQSTILGAGSLPNNQTSTIEHGENLVNVRNQTLANLGVALLEIALRRDIKEYRRSSQQNDTATARRLADGYQAPLGPQYQNIIRKCLHCDFAFGADLKTKELQDAVYSDVVCGIENLINSCQSLGLN